MFSIATKSFVIRKPKLLTDVLEMPERSESGFHRSPLPRLIQLLHSRSASRQGLTGVAGRKPVA